MSEFGAAPRTGQCELHTTQYNAGVSGTLVRPVPLDRRGRGSGRCGRLDGLRGHAAHSLGPRSPLGSPGCWPVGLLALGFQAPRGSPGTGPRQMHLRMHRMLGARHRRHGVEPVALVPGNHGHPGNWLRAGHDSHLCRRRDAHGHEATQRRHGHACLRDHGSLWSTQGAAGAAATCPCIPRGVALRACLCVPLLK